MSPKSLLVLLALALLAANIPEQHEASAVADDDSGGDLAQRQEAMAEVLRVFSNPASAAAADSETVHRTARFLKREMGPLGPIFKAISAMPEDSAADVRAKEEAFDAAQEELFRHFRQLAPSWGKTDEL